MKAVNPCTVSTVCPRGQLLRFPVRGKRQCAEKVNHGDSTHLGSEFCNVPDDSDMVNLKASACYVWTLKGDSTSSSYLFFFLVP